MAIADEALGLLNGTKLSIRQAERANASVDERVALSGSSPNRVVLHQNDPSPGPYLAEPPFVGDPLSGLFTVDGRHRVHDEPLGKQRLGESMKNSGGGSCGDTDHVFNFLGRNVEVVRNLGDAVTRDEPVD